jgi:hypothetical protein
MLLRGNLSGHPATIQLTWLSLFAPGLVPALRFDKQLAILQVAVPRLSAEATKRRGQGNCAGRNCGDDRDHDY